MAKKLRNTLLFFAFLLTSSLSFAQGTASDLVPAWTASSPFEHKVFIRNKGQFDGRNTRSRKDVSHVLYGCSSGDIDIYFSEHGLCYRYNEAVVEEQHEQRKGVEEEDKHNSRTVSHFMNMEWLDASPNAQLIAEDSVSWYFTYGDIRDKTRKTSIKASAFKKIIYKNIYPNIDIEYIFPKDSSGIKYSVILHPGANIEDVKMKYSGVKNIILSSDGNVILGSSFGDFTDHAPVSFYESGEKIKSSFEISGKTISFKLDIVPSSISLHTSSIIIDPWTVSPPALAGTKKDAYDVEYDLQGNVYAYGGKKPYQVIKYSAGGVQQWIYTTIFLTDYYGDFAVDGASGSAYIVEGYRQGAAQIIKINSAGTQIAVNPGTPNQDEYSRIVYNNCIKKAIVVGGGVSGNCQAGILDTTLATYTPVNVLGAVTPLHDFALLAIDNTSQCFMATVRSFNHPGVFDNKLLRCPAATLTPTSYVVSDNHVFLENASVNYTNGPFQPNGTNGFNGIAVSSKYVYTYDGQVIQRRDKLTGAFINSTTVTATPFQCGGITVSDCDDIFVGVEKSVVHYDTNFTVLGSAVFVDTVYDVRLAITNKIYACGKNFVSAFKTVGGLNPCNSLSVTLTPAGSCGSGNVTAVVTGGTPSYSYYWSPGGQTSANVSGLAPGTYTVIVSDNSCVPKAVEDSIVISAATFSTTASSTNATCANNDGTATANVAIGTAPYTYLWSPSGGTNVTATGLSAGSYSVVITDATGCTSVNIVSIIIPNAPVITPSQTSILCNGGVATASVSVSGGNSPYTYAWSPSGGVGPAASNLAAGNYSVVVTDASSCSQTQTFTITQPTVLTAAATSTATSCGANNGVASVAASGGTGTLTYNWSPTGGNNATASGLGVGSYSVLVSDANGCTKISTISVTALGGPVATLSAQTSVSCSGGNNGTASVNVAGGSGPYTYFWSPSGGNSAAASGLSAGNYSCTVTDAAGCKSVVTLSISQPTAISSTVTTTPTPCGLSNGVAIVTAAGGTGSYTYNWLPSGGTNAFATGLAGGTYSVVVTDSKGCTHVGVSAVAVLNGPSANAGPSATIIIGDSTGLNGSGGVTYVWSPPASLSCVSCQNPIASPTVTTTYTLIVTDANGCTDAQIVTVYVEPISCYNKANAGRYYLPNAFSPNNDGENDDLCLLGWDECLKEFYIKIYNRWGELLYESDERSFCWDGTQNGKPLNTGVYAYVAQAILYNGNKKNLRGNISLVR